MSFKDMIGPSQIILIGAILVAIGGFWSASKTQHFQIEVKAKNEEIKRLNDYILSSITGGDSYCYLSLASINNVSNNAILMAVSNGKYPLYDVNFRIVDLGEFAKIEDKANPTLEDFTKNDHLINVGNVPPNTAPILGKINLGSGNKKSTMFLFRHEMEVLRN